MERRRFGISEAGPAPTAQPQNAAGGQQQQAVGQNAQAAPDAVKTAPNHYAFKGPQVDQTGQAVAQAAGQIASGQNVDNCLILLTPVVDIANRVLGGFSGGLITSVEGNRNSPDITLIFGNRGAAEQFAGKINLYRDIRPYCRVTAVQEMTKKAYKVMLKVDANNIRTNYNGYMRVLNNLMTTKKKQTMNESALLMALATGALSMIGGMAIPPIINAVQGKNGVSTTMTYQFKNADDVNRFVKMMKTPQMTKASVKVIDEDNVHHTVTIMADEKKVKAVFPNIEKTVTMMGGTGGNKQQAAESLNESTKVTLTVGQIRRLIKEFRQPDDDDPRRASDGSYICYESEDDCQNQIDCIRQSICKYFEENPWTGEANPDYNPDLSAQDVIDEIVAILS